MAKAVSYLTRGVGLRSEEHGHRAEAWRRMPCFRGDCTRGGKAGATFPPGPRDSAVPHAGLGAGPCPYSSLAVLGDHSRRHQRCGWKEASRPRVSAGEAAGCLETPAAGCYRVPFVLCSEHAAQAAAGAQAASRRSGGAQPTRAQRRPRTTTPAMSRASPPHRPRAPPGSGVRWGRF